MYNVLTQSCDNTNFYLLFPYIHALQLAGRMLVRQEPHLLLKSLDIPVRLL